MRSRKEYQSWKKVERDMREAGYSETGIQRAKESYYQGMDFLCRIFQRTFANDEMIKDASCATANNKHPV